MKFIRLAAVNHTMTPYTTVYVCVFSISHSFSSFVAKIFIHIEFWLKFSYIYINKAIKRMQI